MACCTNLDLPHCGDVMYRGREPQYTIPGPRWSSRTLYVYVPHRRDAAA